MGKVTGREDDEVIVDGEVIEEEELEEEVEEESEADAEDEAETEDAGESESDDEDDDDDIIVTVGDEEPQGDDEDVKSAPKWVKELRKAHRDTVRENRDLKAKLEQASATGQPKAVELGPKPTLEGFDYDAEEYEKALSGWYDKKRKADEQEAQKRTAEEQQAQEWQGRLSAYTESKGKLKIRDFEDAEETVLGNLNVTQQGIILQGAENPALVVYAIGKSADRTKALSSITDPVKFAFAVAKLEKDLKVTNRKAPPAPEKKVSGTAPSSGTVDSQLSRLRAEAEKTGDYTKVMKYRQQQKRKASK